MINTTHNVHIDGSRLDHEQLLETFTLKTDDRYSRWVLKPLAVLSIIGIAAASVIAGTVLLAMSLAVLPLLAIGAYAVKYKLQRDIKAAAPVVDSQQGSPVEAPSH